MILKRALPLCLLVLLCVNASAQTVTYPNDKVAFIAGPQLQSASPYPWFDSTQTTQGLYFGTHPAPMNSDQQYSDSYYDTALVQYLNFYRTGDTRFRDYARQAADSWWSSQWIGNGTVNSGPNRLPPRSMAYAGLMLRALDGRPEMWDFIEREVWANFQHWVYSRKADPTLHYDIREDGYPQLYAVMLAKVLPDSYPLHANGTNNPSTGMATDGALKRATYLAQTEDTAVNFFGRLQRADGSWRWNADLAPDPENQMRDVEQPFMTGLYLEAAVLLHQLTAKPEVKTSLMNQITKSVTHLYNDCFERNAVTDFPQYKWRGMVYFCGGGTVADPNYFTPPKPRGGANGDLGTVRQARHLNSTIHHAYGYAYLITGNRIYKDMGDDVFGASYGDAVDGIHGLADTDKGKDYAMNYRASGRYLVWRLGGATPTPTPTPSPTPTPLPTPTPSPSPTPLPPTSCVMTAPESVTTPRNGTTAISINIDNLGILTERTVTHSGSDGQVRVLPPSMTRSGTSIIYAFQVQAKRQGRTIAFTSPCGTKSVRVNVQ